MSQKDVSLETNLWECSRLSKEVGKGAADLFKILREIEGVVLRNYPPCIIKNIKEYDPISGGIRPFKIITPKNQVIQVHPEPETEVDEKGSTKLWVTFSCAVLKRSSFEFDDYRNFSPTAKLCYYQNFRNLDLSQLAKLEELNDIGQGQFRFAHLVYPKLGPKYGWIDERGSNLPREKSVKKTELKFIFWSNFFGPAYVEKYGRKFLLGAPGWKKEELDDGGVLYVVTENYYDWWTKPPKEVLDYFRAQVPGIKLYRAKSSYD